MMNNFGMVLLTLALVSSANTKIVVTDEADTHANTVTEEKQRGTAQAGDVPAQRGTFGVKSKMQVSKGKLGGLSKFEKVPAEEENMIKDMKILLQEKMSHDYAKGQTKRAPQKSGLSASRIHCGTEHPGGA